MKTRYLFLMVILTAYAYAGVTIDTEKVAIPADLMNQALTSVSPTKRSFLINQCQAQCKMDYAFDTRYSDYLSAYSLKNILGASDFSEVKEALARLGSTETKENFYEFEKVINDKPLLPFLISMSQCVCNLSTSTASTAIAKEFKEFIQKQFRPSGAPLHIAEMGPGFMLPTLIFIEHLVQMGHKSFVLDLIDPAYRPLIDAYTRLPIKNSVRMISQNFKHTEFRREWLDQKDILAKYIYEYRYNNAFVAFLNWFKNRGIQLTVRLYATAEEYLKTNPSPLDIVLANDMPVHLSFSNEKIQGALIDFNDLRATLKDTGVAFYLGHIKGKGDVREIDAYNTIQILQKILNETTPSTDLIESFIKQTEKLPNNAALLAFGNKYHITLKTFSVTGELVEYTAKGQITIKQPILEELASKKGPEPAPEPRPAPQAGPSAPTPAEIEYEKKLRDEFSQHAIKCLETPKDSDANKRALNQMREIYRQAPKNLQNDFDDWISTCESTSTKPEPKPAPTPAPKPAGPSAPTAAERERDKKLVDEYSQYATICLEAQKSSDTKKRALDQMREIYKKAPKNLQSGFNELIRTCEQEYIEPKPTPKPAGPSAPTAKPTTAPIAEPAKTSKLTYAQLRKVTDDCINQLKEALSLEQINAIETNCKNIIKNSGLDIGSQMPSLERLNGELKKRKTERPA